MIDARTLSDEDYQEHKRKILNPGRESSEESALTMSPEEYAVAKKEVTK
jgi:hypothetical protein